MLLNIDLDRLKKIKSDIGAENKAACLNEMLSFWLKSSDPLPSWSAIAEVFEVMGDSGLANKLRSKYCTRLTKHHRYVLFEQLSNCADQWRKIGTYLKFTQSELNMFETQVFLLNPQQASLTFLDGMLSKWLLWHPGDGRGSNNYPFLEDLKDVLRLAGLREAADNLNL